MPEEVGKKLWKLFIINIRKNAVFMKSSARTKSENSISSSSIQDLRKKFNFAREETFILNIKKIKKLVSIDSLTKYLDFSNHKYRSKSEQRIIENKLHNSIVRCTRRSGYESEIYSKTDYFWHCYVMFVDNEKI